MIVDNRAELRMLLATTLESDDLELVEAANGADALELARHAHPDLVIMEPILPGLDGWQVCATLKHDPATKDISIVMLSGHTQETDKRHGKDVGADDYYVKPFSPRELLIKVYDILHL